MMVAWQKAIGKLHERERQIFSRQSSKIIFRTENLTQGWHYYFPVRAMWQMLQEELNVIHPPFNSLRYEALSLRLLREAISPEIRHEEAHLYSHW